MTTDRMPAGNSIPMARIFNPCPYKTLKRSLLKNVVKVPKPPMSAASYIIEIIVIATAKKMLHSIPQALLLAIPLGTYNY